MIAVKDDIIRLFGCQPDPLLGRRLGQSSAIAEDDIWGKNAVVVAADIRLAQGEPRLAVHQPDKGGLRMVGDQLPRDVKLLPAPVGWATVAFPFCSSAAAALA